VIDFIDDKGASKARGAEGGVLKRPFDVRALYNIGRLCQEVKGRGPCGPRGLFKPATHLLCSRDHPSFV
jgi:hypothetical protein